MVVRKVGGDVVVVLNARVVGCGSALIDLILVDVDGVVGVVEVELMMENALADEEGIEVVFVGSMIEKRGVPRVGCEDEDGGGDGEGRGFAVTVKMKRVEERVRSMICMFVDICAVDCRL